MINFRKSQAAMEFLMTYGWAILVVLVAIGALAYFPTKTRNSRSGISSVRLFTARTSPKLLVTPSNITPAIWKPRHPLPVTL